MSSDVALALSGISKSFGGVQALRDVAFECRRGEIHAIVGENGSGKSTLMAIAGGALAADGGTVDIAGVRLTTASPKVASDLGLAIAYQDTALVPQLNVAHNLWLSAPADGRPRLLGAAPWSRDYLARFAVSVHHDDDVHELSPGQRQVLETLKAMLRVPRVLVLDEPTNALGEAEVAMLHGLLRDAAAEGTAVVYISHRLREVLAIADRVTVLRDGRTQGTFSASGLSEDDVLSRMIGAPVDQEFPAKHPVGDAPVVLTVSKCAGERFGPLDIAVRRGEILGVAGAEGNGQRDLVRALGGLQHARGEVRCDGEVVRSGSARRALRAGLVNISGERVAESIFASLGVRPNMTVQSLDHFATAGTIRLRRERHAVERQVQLLDISTPSTEAPIGRLSGGNQQKAVMGRAFLCDAKVLLVDEPTQGIDAKARLDVYRALRDLAASGVAVVVTSSDASELAGLCDRVVVLSRGRPTREISGAGLSEAEIVKSFLTASASVAGSASITTPERRRRLAPSAGTLPLWMLGALLTVVGAWTATRSDSFATTLNFGFVMKNSVPLILVAGAQLCVLLVGGIDLSVGAQVGLTTVLASYWITNTSGPLQQALGVAAVLGVGVCVGLTNGVLTQRLHISPVIATVGMSAILRGVGLVLRETAGGRVASNLTSALTGTVDFVPIAFVVVVGLMVLGDVALRTSGWGVGLRAVGFRSQAAHRLGVDVRRYHLAVYVAAALTATLAGLFTATQVGVGDATIGDGFTLASISAAVLGGAALSGGRGSFVGCALGGLFLALTTNIIPFLALPSAFSFLATGALTLAAILVYSGGEHWRAISTAVRRLLAPTS